MNNCMHREHGTQVCLLWGADTHGNDYGIEEPCITCSDATLPVRVVRVDQATGVALAAVRDNVEEVDITLVEDVVPGALLLVHGGVAIERIDEKEQTT